MIQKKVTTSTSFDPARIEYFKKRDQSYAIIKFSQKIKTYF